MKWVTRGQLGWGPTSASNAPCRKGIVLHYDGSNQRLASRSHESCLDYWKRVRIDHMDKSDPVHGWRDIGYSFGACPHGYALTGRGFQKQQAAQPGGNSDYHSITLMCGPNDEIPELQIRTVNELFGWLVDKGMGKEVKAHSDFISTSCPGSSIRKLITGGRIRPVTAEDDDMLNPEDKKWIVETIRKEVWQRDYMPAPEGLATPDNPEWLPQNVVREGVAISHENQQLLKEIIQRLNNLQ